MDDITLLAAIAQHTQQSRTAVTKHLIDYVNTHPDTAPQTLITGNATPVIWDVLAHSTHETHRVLAAQSQTTPYSTLTQLTQDPHPAIAKQAQSSLRSIQEIEKIITGHTGSISATLADLSQNLDENFWDDSSLYGDHLAPKLKALLTSGPVDAPDQLLPTTQEGNEHRITYPETYRNIAWFVEGFGYDLLDQMDLSANQRLAIAACSLLDRVNTDNSMTITANRYQHLVTSEVIEQIVTSDVHGQRWRHSTYAGEAVTALLQIAAASPHASTEQLAQIQHLLTDPMTSSQLVSASPWRIALHPNVSDDTRYEVIQTLKRHGDYQHLWRITGIPDDFRQQALTQWGSSQRTAHEWYTDYGSDLPADVLIELAHKHVDWADRYWVNQWVNYAVTNLRPEHADLLPLPAIGALTRSFYTSNGARRSHGEIQAAACDTMVSILDPLLDQQPYITYLVSNLNPLPDTAQDLTDLLASVYSNSHTLKTHPHETQHTPGSNGRTSDDTSGIRITTPASTAGGRSR